MASTMNIPGYYYDPERKKYFKIEKSQTAPGGAAWSADTVKRRRLEDEEGARALRRADVERRRRARAPVLTHPLIGGRLDRELGGPCRPAANLAPPAGFAAGLVAAGKIPLNDERWESSRTNVDHLCIDNQDSNTDMCVAFATTNEQTVISTYIPRDRNGFVHRRLLANYRTPVSGVGAYHELAVSQISDIKYHQPSNQVLIASRSPGQDVVIWAFAPKETMGADATPKWHLGWSGDSTYRRINTQGDLKHFDYQANTITPAPVNSNQVCAIGTNRGVVRWVADGYRAWLTPQKFALGERNPYTDVFAVDYQVGHPEVLLFGGRPNRMWIADHRQPCARWDALTVPSSIAHIRSVNEYQVLVAGLQNNLAIYDLRFRKSSNNNSSSSSSNHNNSKNNRSRKHHKRNKKNDAPFALTDANVDVARPLLTFPEYRNAAHFGMGLDYDAGTGVAAAAHDDGRVALFSVRDGRRLRCAALDAVRSDRGPVRSLRFRAFPRDHDVPSLFVGLQSNINVYSFGAGALDNDDL